MVMIPFVFTLISERRQMIYVYIYIYVNIYLPFSYEFVLGVP